MDEIKVPVEFRQQVIVSVSIDDVVENINALPVKSRINYIARMMNNIDDNGIEDLQPEDKEVLLKYFKKQVERLS